MSEVANLYDNGPISPICRIHDNISVWADSKWLHFNVNYIEPVPRSRPFTVDLVLVSGATVIAANGLVAQQAIVVLQMNLLELLQLRWSPLDDVEGALWEKANMARFNPRGGQARVSLFTPLYDPYLATTTFYILGQNRDITLGAWNPLPIAQPVARFAFFGYRYMVDELPSEPAITTYLPAQGK